MKIQILIAYDGKLIPFQFVREASEQTVNEGNKSGGSYDCGGFFAAVLDDAKTALGEARKSLNMANKKEFNTKIVPGYKIKLNKIIEGHELYTIQDDPIKPDNLFSPTQAAPL